MFWRLWALFSKNEGQGNLASLNPKPLSKKQARIIRAQKGSGARRIRQRDN